MDKAKLLTRITMAFLIAIWPTFFLAIMLKSWWAAGVGIAMIIYVVIYIVGGAIVYEIERSRKEKRDRDEKKGRKEKSPRY